MIIIRIILGIVLIIISTSIIIVVDAKKHLQKLSISNEEINNCFKKTRK